MTTPEPPTEAVPAGSDAWQGGRFGAHAQSILAPNPGPMTLEPPLPGMSASCS